VTKIYSKNNKSFLLQKTPQTLLGSEIPANVMDSISNLLNLSNQQSSFFSKLGSFLRLLWYFPGFLFRNPVTKSSERIARVITEYRLSKGIKKVAIQGYCWGGRVAVLLAQQPDIVDVICSAHPGGLSIPNDIDCIQKPSAFILPEKDLEIKEKQIQMIKDSLSKKSFQSEVKYYPNMFHGFAVRGNENDPEVNAQRVDAFQLAVKFFKDVLQF